MKNYTVEDKSIIRTSETTRECKLIVKWNTNGKLSFVNLFQEMVDGEWVTKKTKKVGFPRANFFIIEKGMHISYKTFSEKYEKYL